MKLWSSVSRRPRDRELDEEIQAHLDMATRDRIERGEAPEAATAAARREFGNRTLIKEATRDVWTWRSLESLSQDVRYAVRTMRRAPGFTAVAVLSLTLGIGANTAIFSLINTLMLRPLPVREPQQLVELLSLYPGDPPSNGFAWKYFEQFRDENHVFADLVGAAASRFQMTGDGLEAETVDGEFVVGTLFPALGMQPAIGRLIEPQDDRVGGSRRRGGGGELVVLEEQVQPRSGDSGQANRSRWCAGHGGRRDTPRVLRARGGLETGRVAARGDAGADPGIRSPELRSVARGLEADGTVEAGRVDRAGRRGDARAESIADRGDREGEQQRAVAPVDAWRGAGSCRVPNVAGRLRQAAPGADGGRRPPPADRVYQRRQHAAVARGGKGTRNGRACVARRGPPSSGAAGVDRIAAALRGGQRARCAAGLCRRRRAGADHHVRTADHRIAAAHRDCAAARRARVVVHGRRRRLDRRAVRPGARMVGVHVRAGRVAARRRQRWRDAIAAAVGQEPGGGAGGLIGGAVERGRPVCRPPLESPEPGPRVPARFGAAGHAETAGQRVQPHAVDASVSATAGATRRDSGRALGHAQRDARRSRARERPVSPTWKASRRNQKIDATSR